MAFPADTCAVLLSIDRQSLDIAQGVNEDAARGKEIERGGDQGPDVRLCLQRHARADASADRLGPSHFGQTDRRPASPRKFPGCGPTARARSPLGSTAWKPVRIDTVVVSTQHSPDVSAGDIRDYVINKIINPVLPKELVSKPVTYHVNPTGRFVVGGPHGDCGLTGRKIIVDTYGGCMRGTAAGQASWQGPGPRRTAAAAYMGARYVAEEHRRLPG